MWVHRALGWCAAKGRYLLVAGLLTGMFFETLAQALKAHIPEMAICLLFFAAFRVGPKAAFGALKDFRQAILFVILFQVLVPVFLFGVFNFVGWIGILPAGIALLCAGASVSASPHLAVMTGHSPAPALRLLVLGTALLPLTITPILWLLPQFGDASAVIAASANLFLVIAFSTALAFSLRYFVFQVLSEKATRSVDGASAIFLYMIVVGLMTAVGPALWQDFPLFLKTLAAAFAVNFGLQIFFFFILNTEGLSEKRVPFSIVSGNRNMALFLTALPVAVTDPLLLFIGCYQIPMYLTPMLLGRLYKNVSNKPVI